MYQSKSDRDAEKYYRRSHGFLLKRKRLLIKLLASVLLSVFPTITLVFTYANKPDAAAVISVLGVIYGFIVVNALVNYPIVE